MNFIGGKVFLTMVVFSLLIPFLRFRRRKRERSPEEPWTTAEESFREWK